MKHVTLLFTVATLAASSLAFADAGVDAGPDAETDAAADDAGAAPVPLACDGALCDTSNSSSCDVAPMGTDARGGPLFAGVAALLAVVARRARNKESSR